MNPTASPTENTPAHGYGLLVRTPESKLQDIEKSEQNRQKAIEEQQKPELLSLADHIQSAWSAAKRAKQGNNIQQRFVECLNRRNGEYTAEKLAKIHKQGGSAIYMKLTNVKCRAAESWIRDILLPPGEKPWALSPTPVPTLPEGKEVEIQTQVKEEVVQLMMMKGVESVNAEKIQDRLLEIQDKVLEEKKEKAKKAADRFEEHINDQLVEGNYYKALSEFINDLVTYPTAFLKGPVIRRKKKMVWTEDQNGNYVPAIEILPVREYQRVAGINLFPSPGAKNIQDGYLIERIRVRRSELNTFIGVPGFKESAIRAVLNEYGEGGLREWLSIDQQMATALDRPQEQNDPDPPIDVLVFWGSVQGRKLLEWGMSGKQVPDTDIDYQITAWLIGNYVIMSRLNPHPLGHRPYYAASFESVNDSIWGKSPPELMDDCQDICNATARAIVNNMGIASGPQVEAYMNRMDPSENVEEMYPWKIWKTVDDGTGADNRALNFFQPDPIVDILLKVYEYFFKQASEQSGIPAYVYGSQEIGGAGKTASGLSMLMNAASKTLKGVIAHIDEKVISPSIKEHWNHVMLYDQDIDKIGDINVIARASDQLFIAEQLQLRRSEMLDRTNNDWDRKVISDKGRAHMLREAFDSMKMDSGKILFSNDELDAMQAAQADAMEELNIEQGGEIPPAAAIDAAGNPKGQSPGQTIQGRGLRV